MKAFTIYDSYTFVIKALLLMGVVGHICWGNKWTVTEMMGMKEQVRCVHHGTDLNPNVPLVCIEAGISELLVW